MGEGNGSGPGARHGHLPLEADPDGERVRALDALRAAGLPELDEIPPATHWPSVPAVDAASEWAALRDWVEALQDRFAHLDHHVIPACWWRHNEHVEALAALRDHERVSFSEAAPATAPIEWFRALRDVTALLRAWTGELACAATHQDPPTRLRLATSEGWDAHVAADVERRSRAAVDAAV
jgi:hypothetical protein